MKQVYTIAVAVMAMTAGANAFAQQAYPGIMLNQVQALAGGKPVPLEKQVAHIRTKMKALGYGGASSLLEIQGGHSAIHLNAAQAQKFIVKTDGTAPDLVLYKARTGSDRREVETMKATMTGLKTVKGIIPFSVAAAKDNVFEVIPDNALESGEYFFTVKQSSNPSGPDAFAFSVD